MRGFLIFLSVFIVFAFVYLLLFDTITYKTKHSINQNLILNESSQNWKLKLSMKQIDSLTAFENYKFTINNYSKDAVPVKKAIEKTKII